MDIFAWVDRVVGYTDVARHKIVLTGPTPCAQSYRRIPQSVLERPMRKIYYREFSSKRAPRHMQSRLSSSGRSLENSVCVCGLHATELHHQTRHVPHTTGSMSALTPLVVPLYFRPLIFPVATIMLLWLKKTCRKQPSPSRTA